jgi:hypothetical protein
MQTWTVTNLPEASSDKFAKKMRVDMYGLFKQDTSHCISYLLRNTLISFQVVKETY